MKRLWLGFAVIAVVACAQMRVAPVAVVEGKNIRIEFDSAMRSRVVAVLDDREHVIGAFAPADSIQIRGTTLPQFSIADHKREAVDGGSRTVITGNAGPVKRTETITVYDAFPRMAFFDVEYANTGREPLEVTGWTSQHYFISANGTAKQPAFWSYQSGSYEKRPDWLLPLKPGFTQQNFMGMNATDYGGGTPVVDVWR